MAGMYDLELRVSDDDGGINEVFVIIIIIS